MSNVSNAFVVCKLNKEIVSRASMCRKYTIKFERYAYNECAFHNQHTTRSSVNGHYLVIVVIVIVFFWDTGSSRILFIRLPNVCPLRAKYVYAWGAVPCAAGLGLFRAQQSQTSTRDPPRKHSFNSLRANERGDSRIRTPEDFSKIILRSSVRCSTDWATLSPCFNWTQ
jgi:hypothetical protein